MVRNGHAQERTVVTSVGPMGVKMPRVHDRRPEDERDRFTSNILPPYLHKVKSIDALIPWLYLKGISTGDFAEALQALLGPHCPGLSAPTVTRLISTGQDEHQQWLQRDLSGKHYVYIWADDTRATPPGGVGCIKLPTYWTSCPNVCSHRPRISYTRYGWPPEIWLPMKHSTYL